MSLLPVMSRDYRVALRCSRLESMSRFISLSSTNKILRMINLSRGSPFRLPPTVLRVCYKGGCSAPRDRARATSAMLFYKDGKTVAINRLDK